MATRFKATPRINGFIYIIDTESNKRVGVNGKAKKFKTVNKCSEFIDKLEYALTLQAKGEA